MIKNKYETFSPLGGTKGQVLQADSFQLIKSIPANTFDLILTDPPYELKDLSAFFIECKRVLKESGSIYVFGDKRIVAEYWYSQFKFPHKDFLVWHYKNSPKPKGRWRQSMQALMYGYLDAKKSYFNQDAVRVPYLESTKKLNGRIRPSGGRYNQKPMVYDTSKGALPRDVIEVSALLGHLAKERVGHRDQKPLKLIKPLIEASSKEGQYVGDFFGGSGTTADACEQLNRPYLVVEKDTKNINIIEKRLLKYA